MSMLHSKYLCVVDTDCQGIVCVCVCVLDVCNQLLINRTNN